MPPNDPNRSFLNALDGLAHHVPAPDATERALARTRAALLQSRQSHNKRRFLMRIAIPSTIAAALVAVALLTFSIQSPRQASAAEQLNAAVQTTKAYKGWIKCSSTPPKDAQFPTPAHPLPPQFSNYIHTDGSFTSAQPIDPLHPDGAFEITFWSLPRNEIATYFPDTNEIHLGTMLNIQRQEVTERPAPTTVAEMIALQKKEFGRDPLAIKESPDGDTSRFDITLFASPEEAQKFAKDHNIDFLGTTISVWVNHDHLINRMRLDIPQGPVFFNYTYNVPDIHDIYDIGAPRSAKVVDERLTQNVQNITDRLDAHANGLGNYTALLASYDVDDNDQPAPDFGYIYLYAVQGNRWLADQYRLFHQLKPGRKELAGYVLQVPPPNWPAPDLRKLLPILHDAAPTEYFFMDGDHGQSGWFQQQTRDYHTQTLQAPQGPVFFAVKGLAAHIWPSSINSHRGIASDHADVVHDKARPTLIGLHSVGGGSTWWLDPTRDDMPVESIPDAAATPKPEILVKITFLEYAQLPTGQWYPTHWREDRSDLNPKTHKYDLIASHYHLQIFPDLVLDNSWFQKPEPKTTSPQPFP